MAAPRPPPKLDYSDLEVVTKPATPKLAQSYGLEVHYRNEPEVIWAEHDPTTLPYAFAWSKPDNGASSLDTSGADAPPRTICGLRRRTFWIVVGIVGFLFVVGAVGGGVGGYFSSRKQASPEAQNPYANLSVSALQWVDERGVRQYRVYHQPAGQTDVYESSWDTKDSSWSVSAITDGEVGVKQGTPLASVAGYPHTNKSNDLVRPACAACPLPASSLLTFQTLYSQVRSVYFLNPSGSLVERQSPYKTQQGIWGNDNLSGQYTASETSPLFAYWYQDFRTRFQILAVFFQDFGDNSLTISKYVENVTDGEPWRTDRESMDIQEGSAVAVAPVGDGRDLRVYVGGGDGKLKQYPYDLEDNVLGSAAGELSFAKLTLSINPNTVRRHRLRFPSGNPPLHHSTR